MHLATSAPLDAIKDAVVTLAALEEMIEQERLPGDLAQAVMAQYDQVGEGWWQVIEGACLIHASSAAHHCCPQSMLHTLRYNVDGRSHIKANLKHYRFFDNVSSMIGCTACNLDAPQLAKNEHSRALC